MQKEHADESQKSEMDNEKREGRNCEKLIKRK